jgi:hypothetical protein
LYCKFWSLCIFICEISFCTCVESSEVHVYCMK